MTTFLTSAIAFIALISILVAVHEYGHFIVGRWTGMKVLRYSIGFGKPIWTRVGKKDQTEFCISAIPLGGYVRFLDSRDGIVDAQDEGRAFDQRPIVARIAVLLAGPAFNFVFAIAAYWFLMAGGVTVMTPAVGTVEPGSYAARAGLEFGDKIVRVGDTDVAQWEPTLVAILGEMVDDGRIPLTLQSSDGRERQVAIDVGEDKTRLTEPGELFDGLGFVPWQRPAVIAEFAEDGVARNSELRVGDRITSIDDEPINNFDELATVVTPRAGKSVTIAYERGGEPGAVELRLGEREERGKTVGYLGVAWVADGGETFFQTLTYTPLQSLTAAVDKTWATTVFTVNMLGRMVTGDVSIKNVSGPINIAQIAGQSVERGWRYFVSILAVISISLGVLNLLPVPVLDGGQIVYQIAEAIKGGPLTERAQILGQQVGIFALLLLMSFAFYNDIARLFE